MATRPGRQLLCCLAALAHSSLVCLPALAEEAPGAPRSLEELSNLAEASYPEVAAARARLERLEAELTEVRWRPLSGVRVRGLLAPTPERRGDAMHSAQGDISFSGDMGVLLRADIEASFPIYTFGRLSSGGQMGRLK